MIDRPSGSFDLRFQFGPFPVVIEPGFWIGALIFGSSVRDDGRLLAAWVFLMLVGILVHELGHALAIRAFGGSAAIRLYMMGGLTYPDRSFTRGKQVVVSFAGPFFGFLLGGLALLVETFYPPESTFAWQVFRLAKFINIGWSVMNLLPVLPLDGGHIVSSALGPRRLRMALLVSGVVGVTVALLSLSRQLPYFGSLGTFGVILFGLLGVQNFIRYAQLGSMEDKARTFARADPAEEIVARAWALLGQGEEREAGRIAAAAAETAPKSQRNQLRDVLAWVALAQGYPTTAQRELDRIEPRSKVRALTQAMIHEATGALADAALAAEKAVQEEPSDTSASLAARVYLRVGNPVAAERIVAGHAWKNPTLRDSFTAQIALERADYPLAASLAEAAFVSAKRPADAITAAKATARAGDLQRAALWLKHALDGGFEDLDGLERDATLESLRAVPEIADRLKTARLSSS